MIYKIAVISYVILYVGIGLLVRSWILYKNTGINAFKTLGREGVQGINERVLVFEATLVPIIAFFYLMPYEIYKFMGPIEYLDLPWIKNVGIGIMVSATLFSILAQFQMGDSWRIGINKTEKTSLIKNKLYNYSRNPIYLGLLLSFLGYFLIVPNAWSLCCLVLSYPSLEIKIRFEEAYLLDKHGDGYLAYMEKVRRWI